MAKMGRPPKPKAEKKAETLTLRLTVAERRAVDHAAKKSGMVVSEWARATIVAATDRNA
jgi:uncharacterized protein (DUF1778 family)